jgi:glucosamine 6-phosphate synthetase-like amidotransferase/phosphosugar isomerase protein
VEIASEYRYRHVYVPENTLFVTLSQSGETADTLEALRMAKGLGYLGSLTICNSYDAVAVDPDRDAHDGQAPWHAGS